MPRTALIIGTLQTCRTVEQQLDLLEDRPVTIGWVLTGPAQARGATVDDQRESAVPATPGDASTTEAVQPQTWHPNILGHIDELEAIISRRQPALALVSLPAVMKDLVTSIRTRLRRLEVPDRFMATLEDQLAGVGPRTHMEIDMAALLDRPARSIDEDAVRSVIEHKRILITGAGGSIGSELARIVARYQPEHLMLMDRAENVLFEIDRQIARTHPDLPRKAMLHDVVDAEGTLDLCRRMRPDVIFHAAAHKHVPMMEDHPSAAINNNLFGTKAVADAADAVGCERFVMISTDKAVNPSSIMGATKRLAELYVQDINRRSQTAYSMVRFGNVLGSSGSALQTWMKQIADGGPITVTDERMTRYFMTIPEAASLVIQSAALVDPSAAAGEVFLLDMGEPVRIVDLAQRLISMHGLEPATASEPAPEGVGSVQIVLTGARPGEKLHEELAFDAEAMRPTRHSDINIWLVPVPDGSTIQSMLKSLSPDLRPTEPVAIAALVRRLVPEMVHPVAA